MAPPIPPKTQVPAVSTADIHEAAAAAAKAAVEAMMPAVAASIAAAAPKQAPVSIDRAPHSHPRCPECNQYIVACKGKHERIVVYPASDQFTDWFDGVDINGVRYISSDRNTAIVVPADAAGTIMKMVRDYEENEMQTRMGRKKVRNSGDAMRSNPVTAAGVGGFR